MVRKQDELKFPLIFNHIRLRKNQGVLIFLTCRSNYIEKYLISKLNGEFSGEFPVQELGFDAGDYSPLEFIVFSVAYSPMTLYILSGFPFSDFYKKNGSMDDNIDRLVTGFNIGREYIPDKNLKIIFICPPELEDRIALKAPDFYRFNNYSASFTAEDKHGFLIRRGKEEPGKNAGDIEKKLDFLFESLDAGILDKDKADIYFEIGKLYYGLADMENALLYFREAESLYEKLKNEKKRAAALGKIGVIYFALEQTDKMLEYQKQALTLSKKSGNFQAEADALGNMGVVYCDMGKLAEALKYFKKALQIDRKTGYLQGQAISLGNVGLLYRYMGKPNEALKYLNKSTLLYKQMNLSMPGVFAIPRKKTIPYIVQCFYNPDHRFPITIEIEEDRAKANETEFEAFCPFCGKYVRVIVKERLKPDHTVLR